MTATGVPPDEGTDRPMVGSGLRVTYLVGTYPQLTTTFIDREIAALGERGVDVAIVSIRRPRGILSPDQRALQRRVRYLLPVGPRGVARAAAYWLPRRPLTLLRELAWLLSRPHRGASRMKTVAYVAAGMCAAYRLRDRKGVRVHAHFVDRAATVGAVAASLLAAPHSATAHAADIYRSPFMLREKAARASFVATCTEYNRDFLASQVGRHAGKVVCHYHGLDLALYDPRPRTPADPPLLLAVAQLKEKKGLGDLVEACALLHRRGIPVRCEIVGDGPQRGDLERQVNALGLAEAVVLRGPLPHPEVLARYRAASLFVLPSVVAADGDRDGIPNVILEAMAMQLPVVSTAVSGIPEAVLHGRTGLLVPPHDPPAIASAVADLLASPTRAAELGGAGREVVAERFDVRRNAERLMDLFRA